MESIKKQTLLMKLKNGEVVDERWLMNQGKCTKEELKELVEEGTLELIPKDANNLMSDNRCIVYI